jgi:hypothetical protein
MRLNRVVWLSTLLVSLTAGAQDGAGTDVLKANVEQNLLKPLAQRDAQRPRFSRAGPPPGERRVRILDKELRQDDRGLAYATFAIDVRYADEWSQNALTGCIYPGDGAIYVKGGGGYRSAATLLGKKIETPPDTVCRAKSAT